MYFQKPLASLLLGCLCLVSVGQSQSLKVDLRLTDDQKLLLAAIESKADAYEVAKACQRLAELGDAQAILPLAALLDDPHLSNYARSALEGIPDPRAKAALRDSMEHLEGERLVGVLGSLGRLGDPLAVEAIEKCISRPDVLVSEAAVRALGKIGNRRCAEILQASFPLVEPARRHLHALACLQCGQRLFQEDDGAGGQAMLEFLQKNELDDQLKMAVAVQSILLAGTNAKEVLVDKVRSKDGNDFQAVLHALRQIDGQQEVISKALDDELAHLPADRQASLIQAIAALKSDVALPSVQEIARNGGGQARIEALRLLAQQRDLGLLKIFFEAATSEDSALASTSRQCLADWPSEKVDDQIVDWFTSKQRLQVDAAIGLSRLRVFADAGPFLLPLAMDADTDRRRSAIEALGACGTLSELPPLLSIAENPVDSEERRIAREAVRVACIRLPQQACAESIDQAIAKAVGEPRIHLMDQLAAVGGPAALASIATAAQGTDPELQDAATRLLGEWLTPDVAPVLWELSKSLTDDRFKVRAIRGYLRVARQLDMPLEDRIRICRQALELSSRPEEMTLVLAILKQYPSAEGLELTSTLLDNPKSREAVCGVGLAISQKMAAKHPKEVHALLEKIAGLTKSSETAEACLLLMTQLGR